MTLPEPLFPAAILALLPLSAAALADLAARSIPNGQVAAVGGLGLFARVLEGGAGALVAALCAASAVGLGAVIAWRRGWIGGGDVKLLAAAALLVPAAAVPGLLLSVALAGGLLSLSYLLLSGLLPKGDGGGPGAAVAMPVASWPRRVARVEAWRIRRRGPLPYGVAIAAGAAFSLTFAQG